MPSRTVGLPRRTAQDLLRDQLVAQLRSAGGDPSLLLELLAAVAEARPWEAASTTFHSYITLPYDRGGLGWTVDNLRAMLRMKHKFEDTNVAIADRMSRMRRDVEQLLIVPARKRGRPRKAEKGANVTFSNGNRNARASTLARLERDRPDLVAKVTAGELSAHQAAIEAGFRKRAVQVFPEDVARTMSALTKHFDQDAIRVLVQALKDHLGNTG
jgi:hypothetical protein